MVMETAAKLSYFPTNGGCSNYISPREILHHVKLDYKKHCSMPLLSYVLAHDESTLTNTDSSMDPALLAGVDDRDDKVNEDSSLAGVHDENTALAGVC